MICVLTNGMSFMDKFILLTILLVSFNSFSQALETINNHNNLIECVEVSISRVGTCKTLPDFLLIGKKGE